MFMGSRWRARRDPGVIFLGFARRMAGNSVPLPRFFVIGISLTLGLGVPPAGADNLPALSPHEMCADADAIVRGERVGVNRVRVHRWILQPPDPVLAVPVITVGGLEMHGRTIAARNPGGKRQGPSRRLTSQRLICFLERKGEHWRVLATAREGSGGLIWVEEGRCYRYEKLTGPGPCTLLPSGEHQTEKELLAAVEKGLSDRAEWEEAGRIAHPRERAIVLCSYLLPRTSPEGWHGTYRKRVRRILPKLGSPAVKELHFLLREAHPGDQLDDAVLVLHDLGPAAGTTVPDLVALLGRPEAVNPERVIEALGRIGDATVAPRLLPFLEHELKIRAAVAGAMARFAYQDAVPQIVKALPGLEVLRGAQDGDRESAYHVYTMLQALHELKAEEVSLLTRKYLEAPAMQPMHNLLEPFLEQRNQQ